MDKQKAKQLKKSRRHAKVRSIIKGTNRRPRLSVFRSNAEIYLQIIDDESKKTLVSAHSREIKKKGKKTDISVELGKLMAQRALEKKIKTVIFDRGGYKYHGRVKAVAQGAREGGLKF